MNAPRKPIEIRGEQHNPLLAVLDPEDLVIEIHHHGSVYTVSLLDLLAFAAKTTERDRDVFKAPRLLPDPVQPTVSD